MATTTTTRAAELATHVETANQELMDAVRACSDADWRKQSASESWSAGVLAHHVAISYGPITDMVRAVAEGREPQLPTPDGQATKNARHAEEYATIAKEKVLTALQRNGPAAADVVRGLRDDQLTLTTTAFGGREMSVEQLIEQIVIGHPKQHLASIRDTIGS